MGLRVNSARVAAHRDVFGPDRFSQILGDWLLIGVSSELFATDLEEESEQWEWLATTLADNEAEASVALFLHQPLWWPADRTSSEVRLSVPVPEQERLLALPGADRIRVVSSGHLHRYYHEGRGDIAEVWAPSTAFTSAAWGPELGRLGIIEWELTPERMTPPDPRAGGASSPGRPAICRGSGSGWTRSRTWCTRAGRRSDRGGPIPATGPTRYLQRSRHGLVSGGGLTADAQPAAVPGRFAAPAGRSRCRAAGGSATAQHHRSARHPGARAVSDEAGPDAGHRARDPAAR